MDFKKWQYLNPYDLHKTLINKYYLNNRKNINFFQENGSTSKRDIDIIKENHKFLWNDQEVSAVFSWEQKLAKRYYDKLFKEYCIADLTLYKKNKIGLRWRTEQELIKGKGQFICGSKNCVDKTDLRSWEVNFGYEEHGIKKNALVKLRLCSFCSKKLNYHYKRREIKSLHKSNFKSNAKNTSINTNLRTCNINSYLENNSKLKKNLESDQNISLPQNSDKDVWNYDIKNKNVLTREDEFDIYLNQLFL